MAPALFNTDKDRFGIVKGEKQLTLDVHSFSTKADGRHRVFLHLLQDAGGYAVTSCRELHCR